MSDEPQGKEPEKGEVKKQKETPKDKQAQSPKNK